MTLRELRTKRGWTLARAAAEFGMSKGGYVKLERGERRMNADYIHRAAEVFGVPAGALVEDASVPVIGYVGAGAAAHYYADADASLEVAPSPPGATPTTVAMVVRGESMAGRADDGDLVYFDQVMDQPGDEMIGRLCACELDDGRVLIKKPYRNRDGSWDLFSTNAEPIRGVWIVRAARVVWIRPR